MQTNKPFLSARQLARCAMIAAVYTVLCLSFAPLAFGPVQLRFAEALVLLPVFGPEYILAGTLGCFLSNLLGSTLPLILWNGLTVALGEAVACGVLGVALIKLIETSAGLRRVFTE